LQNYLSIATGCNNLSGPHLKFPNPTFCTLSKIKNYVNEKMIIKAPFITRRLHLGLPALWWRCAERRKVSCRGALVAAPAIGDRRPQSRRHCMPAVAANPCAPASSSVLGFPANFLTQKLGGTIFAGVAAATSALSQLKRTGRRLSVHPFHLRPLVDNVGVYRCT
jgi:hypothetical protein